MKSKLEIYALTVCFTSVVCLVISAGISVHSLFKIVTPQITMNNFQYNKHQTNDAFWDDGSTTCSDDNDVKVTPRVKPIEDDLTKQRMESFELQVKTERREGLQSIIGSIIFVLISSITLFIHFKIAQRARVV